MFLPVIAESYLAGEYRWCPDDKKAITQLGFVANGSITENKWIALGIVDF